MVRIGLNDTTMDIVVKMSDGNPGAMDVIMRILSQDNKIDPQNALGGLGTILQLDTHGIYGTDIYILYNDKCNRNMRLFLMLLRSVQLGFFPESRLKEMASDQMRKINISQDELDDLDSKVCERLDQFQRKEVINETEV